MRMSFLTSMSYLLAFLSCFLFQASTTYAFAIRRDDVVLSPAANVSLPTNWTYIGCYNDSTQTSRTLANGGFNDAKNMNGSACAAYCANKKFIYAGTEYGDECYCGSLLGAPSSLQNDTKCSMPCAANSSEACGAANYLSVYFANKAAPKGPAANPGPPGWIHYGCWSDGNPRTLSQAMATPGGASNLTVALCTSACGAASYTLAGLEYAGECYCDNYVSNTATNASLADCNMPCNGNSSEYCGAGNRLNLYASGAVVPTTKPASKTPPKAVNWASLGCYSDNTGSRSLSHGMNVPGGANNMTNANCINACLSNGYTIAGTEYSGECYCDNNFQNGTAPVTDGRCSMACNGDSSSICGGANGLTVFQFNGWYDQGCYTDNVNGRALRYGPDVPGGAQNMTVENCVAACSKAGYTIAGVEYAGECFCDSALQGGAGPATDGCTMACNGNPDEMCGGPNRLNLYTFNSKGLPTPSSSMAPTSTAAPTSSAANPTSSGAPPPTQSTPTPTPTPPSSVNQTAILPFKYQGCYTDTNQTGRSLANQQPDDQQMTVESCIKSCAAKGFTISGMQYGIQCFCDNYLRNSPALVVDADCSMNCGGSAGEKCGNGGRNSIYSNGTMQSYQAPAPLTTGLPGNWKYAGCLQDNVNNQRTFPYEMTFDDNSNIKCMLLCQQFGFPASGTEYGEQCFCGDPQDAFNAGAQMLPASSCNTRCTNDTGNGGSICGGGNAISYYTWVGTPMNSWTFATGDAAGAYQFLIGGVIVPLVTAPARNGKVTFLEKFGTSYVNPPNSTGAYELDLAQMNNFTAAWRPMNVKTDIFCSASLTLPDRAGRQINVGGWSRPSTEGIRLYWPDGSPGVDGKNDWQENADSIHLVEGRWYPSAMIMSNGSILVMGGEEGSNGAPVPSLEVLPSPSGASQYCDYLKQTDPNNLYPFLVVLPSGKIFVGYYNQALLLDPVSLQPVQQLPQMPGAVNNPLSGRTYPFEGTAVVLPQHAPYSDPLQILICGGSNPGAAIALDNCLFIAPDTPNANWTLERMPSKRVMPCIAALPDGTYLIANGAHQGTAGFGLATDPNLNAVLYDPTKPVGSRMTVMANTTVARLYHSEAVLLDDARVLISGSDPEDGKNPQEFRNEVFVPPYLMGNKPRPAFNLTNLDWSYGQSNTISIVSPGSGGNGYRMSLMGAVGSTHGNSMGQRTIFPSTSCSGNSCTVQAPPNANVCPPGWFQLFLLDGNNVPSHAIWVRIGGDPASLGNWPNDPHFTTPGMGPVQRLF